MASYRYPHERRADEIKRMAYNAGYAEGAGRARLAEVTWNRVLDRLIRENDLMRKANYIPRIREERLRWLRQEAEDARRYGRSIGEEQEGTPERRAEQKLFRAQLRASGRRDRR